MTSGQSDIIDIAADLHHETDNAYLLADGREKADGSPMKEWVPKSKVENNGDGTFAMPEWLAQEKGFI